MQVIPMDTGDLKSKTLQEPLVTILIATYNGELYLSEQLDSIFQQTHKNWTIVASDDDSSDLTISILKQYKIKIYKGPRQGAAANFLSLVTKIGFNSDYYAFADQDDVWKPNKLARALAWLKIFPQERPALYCGRTQLVDKKLQNLGHSPLFKKNPSFKNALTQSIGGGNTMVFNKAAFALLRQTKNYCHVVAHDWWAYLLISGAGGEVYYDPEPYLFYRQHFSNVTGSNSDVQARFYRMLMFLKGRIKSWINSNTSHLLALAHLLTPENNEVLEQFLNARRSWFGLRLIKIIQLGIYRQTVSGQLGLMAGAMFNKI